MFERDPLRFCARCDEPVYADEGHRIELETGPETARSFCPDCFRLATLGYTEDPANFALLRRWGGQLGIPVWREGNALCILRSEVSDPAPKEQGPVFPSAIRF